MLTQVTAKLTGAASLLGWTQVHEFTPESPDKLKLRGRLFAVISVKHTESGIGVIALGRELITRLQEEFYGNLTDKPFNALRDATQKISDEFRKNFGDIEMVAISVVDDVVYSSAIGGSGVMIFRNGSLGKILESEKEKVVSASGFPKSGDMVLLATKRFFNRIPHGVIKAALSSESPSSAVENFGPLLLGSENGDDVGLIVIKFEASSNAGTFPVSVVSKSINFPEKIGNSFKFNYKQKAQSFFDSLSKRIPQRKIYLKNEQIPEISSEGKKLTFTIAAILLALLAISIGLGIRQKGVNDLKNKYEGILQQAQNEVDQAISLASVDSQKSRDLFSDSEQKLNQIRSMKIDDPKVDLLAAKINASRAAILGEYIQTPQMFLDLTLLSSGFKGDTISFSGGTIFILDKGGQRIVSVDISTKKSLVVAGPSVLSSPQTLAAYETKVFVLEGDGIYEVDSGPVKVIDKTWPGDTFIAAFAGNIYVMDKSGNQIYRYQGQNNTFPVKENWLSAGTNVDFSGAVQMIVDGSIYILYPNSKILKFSQGSPQVFSLKGITPNIGRVDAIYASPENQYLYLLDRAGSRVVVTDKKGNYKAQYVDPLISSAINLVASEADKKIILLTGDKLFSMNIQN